MYKVGLEKAEESKIKSSTLLVMEKAREFQKSVCFIDYAKTFDCVAHNNWGKFLKRWEYRPPYLSPEKPVKMQQFELLM